MKELNEEKLLGHQGADQLLDYYLFDELLKGPEKGYLKKVSAELSRHNVKFSSQVIYARAKSLLSGKSVYQPSADVDGRPSAREGKDKGYSGFWTMVDLAFPFPESRYYIGLAANQIDVVRSKVAAPSMVICERDLGRAFKLQDIARFISEKKSGPRIDIWADDVFEIMKKNESSYNIFDLDLMVCLPKPKIIEEWVQHIYYSARSGKIVINITTTIGRSITEDEYEYRAGYLHEALGYAGFTHLGYSPYKYRDRFTPMRSCRYLLQTTKKEKGKTNEEYKE